MGATGMRLSQTGVNLRRPKPWAPFQTRFHLPQELSSFPKKKEKKKKANRNDNPGFFLFCLQGLEVTGGFKVSVGGQRGVVHFR